MSVSWLKFLAQRLSTPTSRPKRRQQKKCRSTPQLETLEARDVPTVIAHPDYVVKVGPNGVTPDQTTGPEGYTPSQIEQGYGFNQISFSGTAGTGAGTTIAIVDAYSDPNIASRSSGISTNNSIFPRRTLPLSNQAGSSSLPRRQHGLGGPKAYRWMSSGHIAIAPGSKDLARGGDNRVLRQSVHGSPLCRRTEGSGRRFHELGRQRVLR